MALVEAARARGEPTVPTTIALERATNPFMRAASVEQLAERRTAKDAVKTGSLEPAVLRTAVTIEPRLDFFGLLIRRVREAAEFRDAN